MRLCGGGGRSACRRPERALSRRQLAPPAAGRGAAAKKKVFKRSCACALFFPNPGRLRRQSPASDLSAWWGAGNVVYRKDERCSRAAAIIIARGQAERPTSAQGDGGARRRSLECRCASCRRCRRCRASSCSGSPCFGGSWGNPRSSRCSRGRSQCSRYSCQN